MAQACSDSPRLKYLSAAQDLRTLGRSLQFGVEPEARMRWKRERATVKKPEATEQRMREVHEERDGEGIEEKARKESS